jgi:hypothetical protein
MTEAHKHNQKIASEGLSRIVALIAQPDFRWFLRETVAKEIERLDGIIHDRRKPHEERDNALSEWTALKRVADWPETFANDCGKTLGHEHRITLDITEPMPNSHQQQP